MDARFGKNNFSLFHYIKDSKRLTFPEISSKAITYEIQKNNIDYLKVIEKISLIQNSVIKKGEDISLYISELEFLLASGSYSSFSSHSVLGRETFAPFMYQASAPSLT